MGIPKNRTLWDGRAIKSITNKGQLVRLTGFNGTVTASWFYLHRDGKLEKRFVISTRPLKGTTITWWGRRPWAIADEIALRFPQRAFHQAEGFFKTAKYQFGLASFGQQTKHGSLSVADSQPD